MKPENRTDTERKNSIESEAADSAGRVCTRCGVYMPASCTVCPHCGAVLYADLSAFRGETKKRKKHRWLVALLLMILLFGAAYGGSFRLAKKWASEGAAEKAKQIAVFGSLYGYLDPDLMPYLEACEAYRSEDWYTAGTAFAHLGDYLDSQTYYQHCLAAVTVETEEIRFYRRSVDLTAGDTYRVGVVILPENASDKSFELCASDPNVLSVDGNIVTALQAGDCNLIVLQAGKEYSRCVFHVSHVEPTEMFFKHRVLTGHVGSEAEYEIVFEPTDTTDTAVEITVDDPRIASVEGDTIICLAEGTTTVNIFHPATGLTASCELTVKPAL